MHTLFTTTTNDLNVFFRSLSTDDIRDCCSPSVYKRGEDYFDSEAVSLLTYHNEKTQLKAIVSGENDYTVTIEIGGGKVSGSCTCPYGDVCKHLVAIMLYANDDESEFDIEPIVNKDTANMFLQYLQSLSKDELIDLVEKFASEKFRTEVKNKFANADAAHKSFHKAQQQIRKFFDSRNLMFAPDDFGYALDNELEKLSGLEKPLCKEIEDLLFYIIEKVEDAYDQGYLYNDYGDDYYEASQSFIKFVVRYVSSLDGSAKTTFLAKLDKVLGQQSYSTFEGLRNVANSVFSDDDLPSLKNVLMTDYQKISPELAGKYYDRVSVLLSYDEKTSVLCVLLKDSENRAIELAALHDANGNLSKAIETLNKWLAENQSSYSRHENAWSFYMDLLVKGKHDLPDIAADAIINCPTDTMLSKIVSITDVAPARYELLLEEKNVGALLRYLQKGERLPEALDLIKRTTNIPESQVLDFFRTHKMTFPEDAETYFVNVIEENLQSAGDHFYEAIADAIRQLAKVNRAKADEYLNHIRTNYKRRRNLITMLSKL